MRLTENWLSCWLRRVVASSTKSSWKSVPSGVPKGVVVAPLLFDIFIDVLDDGSECTFSKFADDTKLGRVADAPCNCAAVQYDLERRKK